MTASLRSQLRSFSKLRTPARCIEDRWRALVNDLWKGDVRSQLTSLTLSHDVLPQLGSEESERWCSRRISSDVVEDLIGIRLLMDTFRCVATNGTLNPPAPSKNMVSCQRCGGSGAQFAEKTLVSWWDA